MEQAPLQQLIRLSGKTAIITGGAMGIGFGIAYRLAEAGAGVVIADMNKQAADGAAEKFSANGWKAIAVQADVANASHAQAMIDAAVSAFGGVDILVNNAGIYPAVPLLRLDEAAFEKVLSVNLKGAFLCTKAAAARMIEQGRGGKVINITSIDALHPSMAGLSAYDASKHGLWGFTKSAALELAPHQIWVNAIAPGAISTPGTGAGTMNEGMKQAIEPFIAKIPMRRMGEPDDIGRVALFLASDLSGYMTGSQIVAGGGALLS